MKALEYIFKFIVRSRVLFNQLYENKGEVDFMESLRNLFTSFNDMMNINSENTGMVKVGHHSYSLSLLQSDAFLCFHGILSVMSPCVYQSLVLISCPVCVIIRGRPIRIFQYRYRLLEDQKKPIPINIYKTKIG
uniref:Dedicator of cytokinesis TPR repeats region domain-containing protein n=1 Tax=Hucho hucho TaxID=62062 RepID=A0A4W5MVL9_9TELE